VELMTGGGRSRNSRPAELAAGGARSRRQGEQASAAGGKASRGSAAAAMQEEGARSGHFFNVLSASSLGSKDS
jgi:hypothetical protein